MSNRIDQKINEAWNVPFEGWDFSYLEQFGGNPYSPLPWSYRAKIEKAIRSATSMLDMGTGGGEFLSSLNLPAITVATEAYLPNIKLASERLAPLGVTVHPVPLDTSIQDNYPLPFEDTTFDLIINRHEAYDPAELIRVLKSGGAFITQQVGQRMGENLQLSFGVLDNGEIPYPWDADHAAQKLVDAGFSIDEQQEDVGYARFFDIRAIVYYLKAIPWEYPDFTPDSHREQLYAMHAWIERHGHFDMTTHHFLVTAKKPDVQIKADTYS